jgi:hypothetical protein
MSKTIDYPCCVVCWVDKGKFRDAITQVKGYAVCEKHASFDCDFFPRWEAAMDPHKQP